MIREELIKLSKVKPVVEEIEAAVLWSPVLHVDERWGFVCEEDGVDACGVDVWFDVYRCSSSV